MAGNITGVIYGEGTADDQMEGLSVTAPSVLGVITLGGAGVRSGATGSAGEAGDASGATTTSGSTPEYAADLGWRYSLPSRRWIPTLGATALYRSSAFSAPGTLPGARPTRVAPWIIGATVSQALPFNTSLVVGGRYTVDGDGGEDIASAFSYFGAQIGRGVSLRASLNVDDVTRDPEIRGRISVTVGVGRGRYRSSFSVPDETVGLSMTQNFDVREATGSGGVSVDAIDPTEGDVGSVAANLRLANPRAEVAGAVRVSPGNALVGDSSDRGEARLRLGSGIYFADGVVGVGRPTTGSFAVIGADPTTPAGPILVNPRGEGAEARSGWLGAAVVSTVPDYYRKPIRVELPDLPIDYAMEWSELVYASEYRSGLGLRVGGGRLLYGTGRLVDTEGEPVALRLVRVVRSGETVYTGYTDENGTFLIYDLVPGDYSLRLGEVGPWARFTLTGDQEPPVDLGRLTVEF
jgi:outer membrane usher protein FimD/PapC